MSHEVLCFWSIPSFFISSQPCVLSQKWVLELEWGTNLRILIEVVLQIIDQHSTCFFYVTSAWCHHKRTWYHWTTTTISESSFYNALFWLAFSWPHADFVVGQLIIGLTFRATYMILVVALCSLYNCRWKLSIVCISIHNILPFFFINRGWSRVSGNKDNLTAMLGG